MAIVKLMVLMIQRGDYDIDRVPEKLKQAVLEKLGETE